MSFVCFCCLATWVFRLMDITPSESLISPVGAEEVHLILMQWTSHQPRFTREKETQRSFASLAGVWNCVCGIWPCMLPYARVLSSIREPDIM
ncbi:hypothetical protein F4680DRAFT_416950 [Xylaria scruposa]|nr:hypothetical protein F4680DRAFT_416950 [Xylaria scruposa]